MAGGFTFLDEESAFGPGLYDDATAAKYDLVPKKPGEHGPSRVPSGPDEGLFLKSEEHPTFYKSVETDLSMGGKIYRNKRTGRIYSFEPEKDVGPEYEELEWIGAGASGHLEPKNKGFSFLDEDAQGNRLPYTELVSVEPEKPGLLRRGMEAIGLAAPEQLTPAEQARADVELGAMREGVPLEEYREGPQILEQAAQGALDVGTFGLLPRAHEIATGEEVGFEPSGTAQQVARGAGELVGFIGGGPGKVAKGVGKLGTRILGPHNVEALNRFWMGRIPVQTGLQAMGLASAFGAASIGEALEKSDVSSALDEIWESTKEGAKVGAVFGAAGGTFPKNRIMRIASVLTALEAERYRQDPQAGLPLMDDRALAQKVFDYGMDIYFAWHGMGDRVLDAVERKATKLLTEGKGAPITDPRRLLAEAKVDAAKMLPASSEAPKMGPETEHGFAFLDAEAPGEVPSYAQSAPTRGPAFEMREPGPESQLRKAEPPAPQTERQRRAAIFQGRELYPGEEGPPVYPAPQRERPEVLVRREGEVQPEVPRQPPAPRERRGVPETIPVGEEAQAGISYTRKPKGLETPGSQRVSGQVGRAVGSQPSPSGRVKIPRDFPASQGSLLDAAKKTLKGNSGELKMLSRFISRRSNAPQEERVFEVSVQPKVLSKFGDKPARWTPNVKEAREITANPERVKDWQAYYEKAATSGGTMTKWSQIKKVSKDGKLKNIPVVSLTKGCQRARTVIERVANGILPNETRVESCYGGDCWVNRQFNRVFNGFENMEVRDLQQADKAQIATWLANSKNKTWLESGPFIRMGQQGCDSHTIAAGLAEEWLKQAKANGLTKKTVFISAGYAPVTEAQYKALAPYKDLFELHISNSGWFHKNEIMLRMAEYLEAKKAGLPAVLRLVTNKDNVSGIEMPNDKFLRDLLKKHNVPQADILETPFHDDVTKVRSQPTGEYKNICCETGQCLSCGVKCMVHNIQNASVATSQQLLMDEPRATPRKGGVKAKLTSNTGEIRIDPLLPKELKKKAKEVVGSIVEKRDDIFSHYMKWASGRTDPNIKVILEKEHGPQAGHLARNMESILSQTKEGRNIYEGARKFKEQTPKRMLEWQKRYREATAGLTDEQRRKVLNLLDTQEKISGKDEVSRAGAQVRKLLQDVRQYLIDNGHQVGYIEGYLPHIFQGKFWVKEEGGYARKVESFGEALKIAERISEETGKPVTVMQDTFIPSDDATMLSQKAYWRLIKNLREGVGDAVEVMEPITSADAREMLQGVAKPKPRPRFFGNLQARVVNNPNYIKDLDQIMDLFFYGASRKVHQDRFWKLVQKNLEAMPQGDADLRKFIEDIYMPQVLAHPTQLEQGIARAINDAKILPWQGLTGQDIRKTIHNVNLPQYVMDLGLSASSAVANSSQFWINAYPIVGELSAVRGYRKGLQTFRDKKLFEEVDRMGITHAVSSITGETLLPKDILKQVKENFKTAKTWQDGVKAFMETTLVPFGTVEMMNRFGTYWAGKDYAMAQIRKGKKAVDLARKVAPETSSLMRMAKQVDAKEAPAEPFARQFGYELNDKVNFRVGRENLPQLLQKSGFRLLAPYKSFLLNQLKYTAETLSPKGVVTDPRKAIRFSGASIALAGVRGNPILWGTFLGLSALYKQLFGEDLAYELQRRRLGKANFLLRGVGGEIGLDVSGSVAMILPQRWEDLLGRFGQIGLNLGRLALGQGDVFTERKVMRLLQPSQVQRVLDAIKIVEHGEYRSPITKTPVAVDNPWVAAVQRAFGAMPKDVARTFDEEKVLKAKQRKFKQLSSDLTERWATAVQANDAVAMNKVMDKVTKEMNRSIEDLARATESGNENAIMEATTDVMFWVYWIKGKQKFKNALERKVVPRQLQKKTKMPTYMRPEALQGMQ